MNRIYALIGLIGIVALPARFARVLADDLAHPERTDWRHNPKLYVPLGGALLLVAGGLLVRELLRPRLAVRLQRLLDEAERLREDGRHAEADRVLDKFEALWEWHGLGKGRPLR